MKKFSKLILLSVLLGLVLVLNACADNSTTSENINTSEDLNPSTEIGSSVEKIKEAGKIVLGTNAFFPPYEFHMVVDGEDQIVGFDIEIAKEIAKSLDVELEIRDMDFKGLIMALNTGKVDFVIAGMTPTPERAEVVDFSQIYYEATNGVVINTSNQDKFKTLDDLSDKRIGAQLVTVQEEVAKAEIGDSNLKLLSKIPDLVLEVENNKLDGLVIEKSVAKAYIDRNENLVLMDLTLDAAETGAAVAIKKGNTDLLNEINKTLDRLIQEGSIDEFIAEAIKVVDQL